MLGLPYFVLSSTGPLVQAWLSYHDNSDRVYRLYALSNAGSLAALLSYPFLVEPVLSVSSQSVLWSLMFCGFVLVQGVVAIGLFRVAARQRQTMRPDSVTDTGTSEIDTHPNLAAAWRLDGIAGTRFDDAAGGHESCLPRHRRDPIPMGAAAQFVPDQLHRLF